MSSDHRTSAPKLRLYVWDGVLTDYSSGIMFALAESVEHARELLCPGWNEAEAALKDPGFFGDRDRPNGHYIGMEHIDLRQEPEVVEAPKAFSVWGGG